MAPASLESSRTNQPIHQAAGRTAEDTIRPCTQPLLIQQGTRWAGQQPFTKSQGPLRDMHFEPVPITQRSVASAINRGKRCSAGFTPVPATSLPINAVILERNGSITAQFSHLSPMTEFWLHQNALACMPAYVLYNNAKTSQTIKHRQPSQRSNSLLGISTMRSCEVQSIIDTASTLTKTRPKLLLLRITKIEP